MHLLGDDPKNGKLLEWLLLQSAGKKGILESLPYQENVIVKGSLGRGDFT